MAKQFRGSSVIVLMLIVVVLGGCGKPATGKEDIPLVRSQIIKRDYAGAGDTYSGEVRGRYERALAFQVSGKIAQRNVELGSRVKAGDVLMAIDAKDIVQTANITAAQAAAAQSQLTLAATNLDRYRQLYAQGAASRAQLDQYQNAYEVALAASRQGAAQYAQGSNQLSYSDLVAEADGVVSSLAAETGQVVSAGQTVLTVVEDGEREIEINVPENRIAQLRSAGSVAIRFWALPDAGATGKVREIAPVADKVTRTYKVRIAVADPPAAVALGMTATVAVADSARPAVVFIPLGAIYQTGDTPQVWVVQDGLAQLRAVKIGSFGDGKVQILEGLREGDVVVTAGVQKLQEGQRVRL